MKVYSITLVISDWRSSLPFYLPYIHTLPAAQLKPLGTPLSLFKQPFSHIQLFIVCQSDGQLSYLSSCLQM